MIGWIIIGIWVLCGVGAWRPALRYFNREMKPDDWSYVISNILFATVFSFLAGPGIAARAAFQATVARRVDPETFAKRLEGASREEQMEARIRRLEARNAQLERELGL